MRRLPVHCLLARCLPVVLLSLVTMPLAAQSPARWFATWAPSAFAAPARPPRDSVDRVPTFADRTVRQIVRTTLGGTRVRVRFTNEFGDRALVIGAASIALRDTGLAIRAGTGRPLTFGGRRTVTIRRGAVMMSDPVEMAVPALTDLAISLWVTDTIRASTRHALGLQSIYVSSAGNFSDAADFRADTTLLQWLWLAGVDVVNPRATGVIATLGNSITDGAGASANRNTRWPDVLARRLQTSREPLKGVVNAGISGNGVLSPITGPSALARFDRDVLMQPGVTHVILLEGINDLARGAAAADARERVSAEELIAGYQQLIARAHERGLVIFGATMTPMANMGRPSTPMVDSLRRVVNEWIRTSGAFDGVIDFDRATRDPAAPGQMVSAYDSGDHLHPSDAGYQRMGESIDLTLFRRKRATR